MLHTRILQFCALLSGTILALSTVVPALASNEASVYNEVFSSASSGTDGDARAEAHVRTIINGEEVVDTTESETGESASVTINEVVVTPAHEYQQTQQFVQEDEMPAGVQSLIPTLPSPPTQEGTSATATEGFILIDAGVPGEESGQSNDEQASASLIGVMIAVAGDVAEKIKSAIHHAVDYLFI